MWMEGHPRGWGTPVKGVAAEEREDNLEHLLRAGATGARLS